MTKFYGEIALKNKLAIKYSVFGIITLLLTALDQLTKMWIVSAAEGIEGRSFTVIKGVLNFTYLKNYGASMGMFKGQRVFLIILTVVVITVGVLYFKKHKPTHPMLLTAGSLVLSGAIGNLIDRMAFGYVRDFIDVQFIDFYIFNVADCAICIGAGLLMLYALLYIED